MRLVWFSWSFAADDLGGALMSGCFGRNSDTGVKMSREEI